MFWAKETNLVLPPQTLAHTIFWSKNINISILFLMARIALMCRQKFSFIWCHKQGSKCPHVSSKISYLLPQARLQMPRCLIKIVMS